MNPQESKKRVKDFVDHLLSNPTIKNEPLLIGEGLILNFIIQNMGQLKATFRVPQFFPDLEWEQVLQLILADIYERIINTEFPVINEFVKNADFDFLNKITNRSFPSALHQEKIKAFVDSIFKNKDVRYNFNSVINIFKYNILERYIGQIFDRREYLYNELVRVQKTYLEADEYINFLKILLLIRNSAFMKVPISPDMPDKQINFSEYIKNPRNIGKVMNQFVIAVNQSLPNLDEKSITLAIKSNLGQQHTEIEDASSRFLYLLTSRFTSYKPTVKLDRGAESPDKSWFAIAKKNAEATGYDKRMLEELYRVASDNNW